MLELTGIGQLEFGFLFIFSCFLFLNQARRPLGVFGAKRRGSLLLAAALFAHRFALHLDALSVVDQPVENAIGQGLITDLLVPLGHREFAGQDHRSPLVAVLADFQEVPALGIGQRRHRPVVDHQRIQTGQPGEQRAQTAVGAGQRQVAKQLGGPRIEGRKPIPAGFLGQGAGQEALVDPLRSRHIMRTLLRPPPFTIVGILFLEGLSVFLSG